MLLASKWASGLVDVQTTRAATPGLAPGGYSPSSGVALHREKGLLYLNDVIIFAIVSRGGGQANDHVAQDASQDGKREECFRRALVSEHVKEN
jgi:hypothetical protein